MTRCLQECYDRVRSTWTTDWHRGEDGTGPPGHWDPGLDEIDSPAVHGNSRSYRWSVYPAGDFRHVDRRRLLANTQLKLLSTQMYQEAQLLLRNSRSYGVFRLEAVWCSDSCSTLGTVTTWMGDCLLTAKPSRYVPKHQGQLSSPSLRGRLIDYQQGLYAGCVHSRQPADPMQVIHP